MNENQRLRKAITELNQIITEIDLILVELAQIKCQRDQIKCQYVKVQNVCKNTNISEVLRSEIEYDLSEIKYQRAKERYLARLVDNSYRFIDLG